MSIFKFQIVAVATLLKEGFKIGKLAANRHINPKVVKAKKDSLVKCGQAVPAIVVMETEANTQGLVVLDFETGEVVTDEKAAQYVVLIDGNHRYQAHVELVHGEGNYSGEFYVMFPLNEEQAISELLAEINTCTKPWSGADYVVGAVTASKSKLPMLTFIHSLTSKGYSLPSASEWATLSQKVSARDMTRVRRGEGNDKLLNDVNLEAGIKIHEAACFTLGDEPLKTRTIIDWIIAKRSETSTDSMVAVNNKITEFFTHLTEDQVAQIKGARGKSGGDTKEAKINKLLTEFYNDFQLNSSPKTEKE